MYETFFGFRERPFPAVPLADAYFPSEAIEHARKQLARTLERGEGCGMVVGGVGTGKSLLLQKLMLEFSSRFHVALLAGAGLCTRRALLQSILFELRLPYRGMEEGELRLSLLDHLRPSRECVNGMLLLIDEAHSLPIRLLEEIRLITNLAVGGQPRVRLVLAGSPILEERFASPKLESFTQRVVARCYLQSMSSQETADYVRHEVKRVGGDAGKLFGDDALRAIHQATDGIPRLINQVCDHAMFLAAAGGQRRLDAAGIQEAWADLQQLPSPWQPEKDAMASIEFGSLRDSDDESAFSGTANSATAKLDEIDDALHALDDDMLEFTSAEADDFQPPARGSEVELVFQVPPTRDLFGVDFDEEEILIDRFAALDTRMPLALPQVSTPVGRAFTAETKIVDAPVLRIAPLPEPLDELPLKSEKAAPSKPRPLAQLVAASKDKTAKEKKEHREERPLPTVMEMESPSKSSGKAMPMEPALDPVFPEPETLPLVGETGRQNAAAQVAAKRRPQFGQLFASLRRGS